jgi:DNA polymerase
MDSFSIKKLENQETFMSQEVMHNCVLCDASKISKNKIFGNGNIHSKIMFLSTVPSFDEASEEMFNKMIENVIGIPINEIYLTSIIKCDLSDKTLGIKDFAQKCKGYITNQMEQSSAKIIVTLGDSYNYVLNNSNEISSVRGTVIKLKDKSIIPIYHPSFLLRNPSLKKETFDDLKKIKLLLEQV